MEEKIKNAIYSIYRQYGEDKTSDYPLRESRILNLCMNDLASHPGVEKELDTEDKVRYFVMQTILSDIPLKGVTRLC